MQFGFIMKEENNKGSRLQSNNLYLQVVSYIILLVIPIILLLSSLQSINKIDKNWYGAGYDPSYAYLYNSLNIATLKQPGHFDHPGTPMQIIGGAILRSAWLVHPHGGDNLADAVIRHPEFYLNILNIGTALLGTLSFLLAGLFLYRFSKNIWYALLIQASPFIANAILYTGFVRISQENVLMIACIGISVFALNWYFNNQKYSTKYFSIGFGIISGFGIASKIIFIPLILIPLMILQAKKERYRFLKVTIVSFIFCTIPIIFLYPHMGWWFIRLFLHSGIYGTGSASIIEPTSYFTSLIDLLTGEPIYLTGYLISLVYVFIALVKIRDVKKLLTKPANKLLIAIVLVQTFGYLITAKHPKLAYLLPYECLLTSSFIVMIHEISATRINKQLRLVMRITLALIFIFTVITLELIKRHKLFSLGTKDKYEQTWQLVEKVADDGAIIGINPGSSPIAANFFGNAYSFNRYSKLLSAAYPDYYIYDTYGKKLISWEYDTIALNDLAQKYQSKVIIIGDDVDLVIKELTIGNKLIFEKISTPVSEVALLKK